MLYTDKLISYISKAKMKIAHFSDCCVYGSSLANFRWMRKILEKYEGRYDEGYLRPLKEKAFKA